MSGSTHLTDFKAKHFLKICRLTDEQQIEGPAPAEVGHNDCIDRHGGEELLPRSLVFLWESRRTHTASVGRRLSVDATEFGAANRKTHIAWSHQVGTFPDALLYVNPLLLCDGRMLRWTFIRHQDPEHVPDDSEGS